MLKNIFLFVSLFSSFVVSLNETSLERNKVYLQIEDRFIEISQANAGEYFNGLEWFEVDHEFDLPALVIKKVSDDIGFGLFAGEDIHEGQAVVTYTGEVHEGLVSSRYNLVHKIDDALYSCDAERVGNAGRFMLHLPANQKVFLHDYEAVQNIAKENVEPLQLIAGHMRLFVASKEIKKGEAIGYDYGPVILANEKEIGNQYCYFKKDGTPYAQDFLQPFQVTIIFIDQEKKHLGSWEGDRLELIKMTFRAVKICFNKKQTIALSSATLKKIANGNFESTFVQPEKVCNFCGAVREEIKRCAKCKIAQYCNSDCQSKHWKQSHKGECSKF